MTATREQLVEHLRFTPDASAAEVIGATGADPSVWLDAVDDALATDEPHLALETPDTGAPEGGFRDENPGLDAGEVAPDPAQNGEIEIYEDGCERVAGQPEDGGVRTDPDEFKRFHELLTADTPDGYTPYYIKCERDGKAPVGGVAWSDPENSLSVEAAMAWLESGGNIGIVGTTDDCLVDLDVDDPDLVDEEDVKQTLRATSRSRGGYHGWYFGDSDIPNIDSDAGEIRTDNQYVLAPGSHVPVNLDDPDDPDLDEIATGERANVGRYSLADEHPVARLEYEEIPPIYREEHEQRQEVIEQRPDHRDDPPDPTGDGDNRSAIFDLDITDVTGLSWGYRGVNPTGHHSNDHRGNDRYFKIDREHGGRDFKDNVSYSPASWALADAGERDPAIPNGGLTDREYFVYWQYCKENNLVPADDPIPRRALRAVARDATEWDGEVVEHDTGEGETFDGLPRDAYNAALDAVREEYGLDPGRRPAGAQNDPDAEPVAPLALAKLDAINPNARRRAAKKRGLKIPSTEDARGRLRDALFREMGAGNTTVVDFPTAGGKSHEAATEPWRRRDSTTGGAPVVQLHQTREARDEAAAATREDGGTGAVLRGRKEASPLARGDHDPVEDPDAEDAPDQVVTIDGKPASEWFDLMCDEKGLPFSTALATARNRNDQGLDELPPVGKEDPAVAQWDGLPRDDDGNPAVDVIHATHQFAYVPSLRTHTNLILDEEPDFTLDLEQDRVRRMVNAYLQQINAPVTNFEAFVTLAEYGGTGGDAAKERDALESALDTDRTPPAEWYVEEPDAHAIAPDLTRALWNALRWEEPNLVGRRSTKVYHEPPRFDAEKEGFAAGTWLSVVVDEDHTVKTVRTTPDFSQARAVIGLDAHPSMPKWELNGAPGMTRDAVLDPTERRLWRRYERGLTVVQVGDAARPRSGEDARDWMNDERVRAVLDVLREHYGDGFKTAISTVQTEPALLRLLADVTGDTVEDVREFIMHYGEEKSRNDFAEELAGYVYGCMDPGDDMILNAITELGLEAKPATVETEDGEVKREKGRTFDGADADTAAALLASVRENHVAQAAGRYARNPTDPESSATVFLHTNAAPAGFVDLEVPGVEWLATDLQREIITELTERPAASTREIADAVECTKEHVRKTLARLEGKDLVDRDDAVGENGADVFRDTGADTALVDLGEPPTAPYLGPNRWSLAVHDRYGPEGDLSAGAGASSTDADAAAEGDPPPNDPD